MALTGTDAQIVRPYRGLLVLLYNNGRHPTKHFRASLQRATRLERIYKGLLRGSGLASATLYG